MCKFVNGLFSYVHSRATLNGSTLLSPTVLVDSGIRLPESVAFDWLHKALYWVDSTDGAIRVVTLATRFSRTVHRRLDRPRALVLDPNEGYNPSRIAICCCYVVRRLRCRCWGMLPAMGKTIHSVRGVREVQLSEAPLFDVQSNII